MNLEGKHVLITGAAKRVGRAIAERLLGQGAKLTAHYHTSREEAQQLLGPTGQALPADLRKIGDIEKLLAEATATFGAVDILINSASDFYPTPTVTEAEWDSLLNLNLRAAFFLSQACGKIMAEKKSGAILNLVDTNIYVALPRFGPYIAAKGGLWALTRTHAKEFAPYVRVNSISPGPVLMPENFGEEKSRRAANRTLLKRLGSAEDIANAAVFLLENDYITGFDLVVDGGQQIA